MMAANSPLVEGLIFLELGRLLSNCSEESLLPTLNLLQDCAEALSREVHFYLKWPGIAFI